MSTTTEVRSVTVGGRLLRVAVRPGRPNGVGDPPRCPLLLINGIGASLEVLEPLVAELDPAALVTEASELAPVVDSFLGPP